MLDVDINIKIDGRRYKGIALAWDEDNVDEWNNANVGAMIKHIVNDYVAEYASNERLSAKAKRLSKDEVKNISPALSGNPLWAEYVDWFYNKPGFEDYASIALGFSQGYKYRQNVELLNG